jgi:hypothetical protein
VPIYLRDDVSVLFVHVPKAGGTSIELLFRRAGFSERMRTTPKSDPPYAALRRCSPQHMHAELLSQVLRLELFDLTFMTVREPLSRFRSEYLMRQKGEPDLTAAGVERWAREKLDCYRDDPYVLDNHLRPQTEYLVPGVLVHRLEDGLESLVERLNDEHRLGLAPTVPRRLVRRHARDVPSGDVPLTAALEAELREFYSADFTQLGY